MRVGDFGVEIVPREGGRVRELESGHVLARPGQVYAIRLRNSGPLRCVADVTIDGQLMTVGGLVLEAWSTEELERPIEAGEDGRFTVFAEGDERVFGPDGGRDDPNLGLIHVRFRRELPPVGNEPRPLPPAIYMPEYGSRAPARPTDAQPFAPRWTMSSHEFLSAAALPGAPLDADSVPFAPAPMTREAPAVADVVREIERAAGTGLTGHSAQRFAPAQIGPLEHEATVIQLRLVVGTDEAIDAPGALPDPRATPARPAARP